MLNKRESNSLIDDSHPESGNPTYIEQRPPIEDLATVTTGVGQVGTFEDSPPIDTHDHSNGMASPQNEIPTQASKQSLPKYEITEQLDEQLSLYAKHRDLKKPDYRFSEITTLQRQENCCELFDEKTPPIFRTQSYYSKLIWYKGH